MLTLKCHARQAYTAIKGLQQRLVQAQGTKTLRAAMQAPDEAHLTRLR